jgi:hypothetical protein
MRKKESMKLQELNKLAEKVQLKIKPEEIEHLLTSLSELESLLVKFRKLKLEVGQSRQSSAKITLPNLHQLAAEKFLAHVVKQETIRHNARVSANNFVAIYK